MIKLYTVRVAVHTIFFYGVQFLRSVLRSVLNGLHRDVMGSAIIELLAKKSPQRRFTESLMEAALERDVFLNEHILLEGGKSIKMENLLKSRYFKRTIEKVKQFYYK